jgi:TrmH family RNA methyltransferase
VAEGPQAVREAIRAHHEALTAGRRPVVRELYLTDAAWTRYGQELGLVSGGELPSGHRTGPGFAVHLVTDEVLVALADTVTPQGLLAVCETVDVPLAAVLGRAPLLIAVAAHVRDPGNAGTIVRAADAAGAEAVVLSEASVDVYNPKCVRSTAGSLFHLSVSLGAHLGDAVSALHGAGLTVLAADGAGDTDLDDLQDQAETSAGSAILARPVAWLFGNEAWGLPEDLLSLADAVVRVPVHGRAESLNLATAATVCLYATARAQRRPGGCRTT